MVTLELLLPEDDSETLNEALSDTSKVSLAVASAVSVPVRVSLEILSDFVLLVVLESVWELP